MEIGCWIFVLRLVRNWWIVLQMYNKGIFELHLYSNLINDSNYVPKQPTLWDLRDWLLKTSLHLQGLSSHLRIKCCKNKFLSTLPLYCVGKNFLPYTLFQRTFFFTMHSSCFYFHTNSMLPKMCSWNYIKNSIRK
jgi:hypothetical protein